MDKQLITKLSKSFEDSAYQENGVEYWLARDLQVLLEYDEWRNFFKVIEKAKISCQNSGQKIADHFVYINKTIPMPKGAAKNIYERGVDDQGFGRIRSKGDQALFGVLTKSGIKPEELPPEEDLKKLERRVKTEEKQLGKDIGKLTRKNGLNDDGE
jgi:DNA-damage-inducible protein D